MYWLKRSLGGVIGLAVLAAACGGTDAVAPATTAGGDPAAYCAALGEMFATQPPEGPVTDQFETEMAAYSAAIDLAAASAPADQQASLIELAAFVRDTTADPTADGTLERAFAMIGAMLAIQSHAENECGLTVDDRPERGGIEAPPIRFDAEIDAGSIEAANSAVPDGIELTFEAIQTPDDEYPVLVVAPVGWEMNDFFGFTFEPPEDSDLGFFSEFRVSDGCDGICAPQDWSVLMDNLDSGPFSVLSGEGTVLFDKVLTNPTGRLVVYEDPDAFNPVVVVATRWSDRSDKYFKCEAQLDDGDEGLWVALAAACEASIPMWIPAE